MINDDRSLVIKPFCSILCTSLPKSHSPPSLDAWSDHDTSAMAQTTQSSRTTVLKQHNSISINQLQRLVMCLYRVLVMEDQLRLSDEPALVSIGRGDNMSAVRWINKRGWTKDPRAAEIMRFFGTLEVTGGWRMKQMK